MLKMGQHCCHGRITQRLQATQVSLDNKGLIAGGGQESGCRQLLLSAVARNAASQSVRIVHAQACNL